MMRALNHLVFTSKLVKPLKLIFIFTLNLGILLGTYKFDEVESVKINIKLFFVIEKINKPCWCSVERKRFREMNTRMLK